MTKKISISDDLHTYVKEYCDDNNLSIKGLTTELLACLVQGDERFFKINIVDEGGLVAACPSNQARWRQLVSDIREYFEDEEITKQKQVKRKHYNVLARTGITEAQVDFVVSKYLK